MVRIVMDSASTIANRHTATLQEAQRSTVRALRWVGDSQDDTVREALATSSADLVVADLEDTVSPRRKHEAREILRRIAGEAAHHSSHRPLFVRINPLDTAEGIADLAVLAAAGIDGLVVPKATPEVLRRAFEAGVPRLIALVETAEGVERVSEIARCPAVELIELGAMDLSVEMRTEPMSNALEIAYVRSRLVIASRAAGLPGPIDATYGKLHDLEGYRAQCEVGRAMGFAGGACLTEDQVVVAREVFAPTAEAVRRAREIVEAYDAAIARGEGVVEVDGVVVERPVAEKARLVLTDAGLVKASA
jgi:citrate lyase subunit beta/citryl-CoA lyase